MLEFAQILLINPDKCRLDQSVQHVGKITHCALVVDLVINYLLHVKPLFGRCEKRQNGGDDKNSPDQVLGVAIASVGHKATRRTR